MRRRSLMVVAILWGLTVSQGPAQEVAECGQATHVAITAAQHYGITFFTRDLKR